MKISILFILYFLITSLGIHLKLNAQEYKILGTPQEDISHSLKEYQGIYYIVGTTRKTKESAKDYYFLSLYADGSIKRQLTYGFTNHDIGNQVLADELGIYLFGNSFDYGFANVDMHLAKIDENGDIKWNKFFGTKYQDLGFDIIRTNDDGFAMIGFSNLPPYDGGDMYCVKADKDGNVEWEKSFGPPKVDYGFGLLQNSSDEFLFVGTQNGFYNPTQTEFATHDADIMIVKTDKLGNVIWNKTYGGSSHDWAKNIILAPDGGYYVCGSTQSYGSGSFDMFLMKIDEDGNELWIKTYGGSNFEYGEKVVIGKDKNLYLIGTSASFSDNKMPDYFLVKTNLDGDTIWTRSIDGGGSEYGSGLVASSDSGCVFSGYTNNTTNQGMDISLYRITKDGTIETLTNYSPLPDSVEFVQIFPNPSKNRFTLRFQGVAHGNYYLELYSIKGEKVYSQKVEPDITNSITSNVAPGTYVCRLSNNSTWNYSTKIILR
jgi:hypothetical protein